MQYFLSGRNEGIIHDDHDRKPIKISLTSGYRTAPSTLKSIAMKRLKRSQKSELLAVWMEAGSAFLTKRKLCLSIKPSKMILAEMVLSVPGVDSFSGFKHC